MIIGILSSNGSSPIVLCPVAQVMVLPAVPACVQKSAVVPCMAAVGVLLRMCVPVRTLGKMAMTATLPVSVVHRVCHPSVCACNNSGILALYRVFCVRLFIGRGTLAFCKQLLLSKPKLQQQFSSSLGIYNTLY